MKRKSIATLLFSLILSLIVGVVNSFAYCVHNETDIKVNIKEYAGGSFVDKVQKGKTKCCNWKNHICNSQGKKDSIVKINVTPSHERSNYWIIAENPKSFSSKSPICNIAIKADAHLVIRGSKGKYKCLVYDKY